MIQTMIGLWMLRGIIGGIVSVLLVPIALIIFWDNHAKTIKRK